MVFIQELADSGDDLPLLLPAGEASNQRALARGAGAKAAAEERNAVRRGFLMDTKKHIYGPGGSRQGEVSAAQKQEWERHRMNQELNKKMGINPEAAQKSRAAREADSDDDEAAKVRAEEEAQRPPWFNPEWPSECQYNNPGCTLGKLAESRHETAIHRDVARRSDRYQSAGFDAGGGGRECHLSFTQLTDEDLADLQSKIEKHEDTVEQIDLSYNNLCDRGVQMLVAWLVVPGRFGRLSEVKLYNNDGITALAEQMIGALKLMRPEITVWLQARTFKFQLEEETKAAEKKKKEAEKA